MSNLTGLVDSFYIEEVRKIREVFYEQLSYFLNNVFIKQAQQNQGEI